MSSKLFVKEDEDDEMEEPSPSYPHTQQRGPEPTIEEDSETDTYQDLEDPVIKEIPIILKSTDPSERLLLLQYPGRPSTRPFTEKNRILEAREKVSTDVIEVDVPIDTTRFYDPLKNDNWGVVNKQTLRGVMNDSDGYYVASVQNGELVLVPVSKSAQMRPAFNYIDKEVADKKEVSRLENGSNGNGHANSSVQVVQMTVKSTVDNAPRLGGALLARKKADEEDFVHLNWNDLNDEETKNARETALTVENKHELNSSTTNDEYINLLVQETIVE